MYINFKNKYKKIFWLLLGFILACVCVQKVNAYSYYDIEINQEFLNTLWSSIEGKTTNDLDYDSFNSDYVYHQSDYPYVSCSRSTSNTNLYICEFFKDVNLYSTINSTYKDFSIYFQNKTDNIVFEYKTNTNTIKTSCHTQILGGNGSYKNYYWTRIYTQNSSFYYRNTSVTNFTITDRINQSFDYSPLSVPDYLTGYKKVTLTTDDKYVMLSYVSSGSVYIPTQDFEQYGGRLSYYDNDIDSQPYTSYIQDYYKMPDGEFIRQDFDISFYYGADWVMFSKYIYLEGEDDITYDIWVPDDSYDSIVEITPNSQGGNDFDFEYKDQNGDIQSEQAVSVDLTQISPLLGNVFSDFSSNTFGLTSIITAPLSLISSLSSSSCSTLNVPLPFINSTLTLPCMNIVYSNTFGSFFTLYQTITTGIISYWVIVKIFNLVKDFKNPDHDEIEVVDL